MENSLRVFGPSSELDAFNEEAEKAGLEQKPQLFNFSADPQNIASHLDFFLSKDGLAMGGILAAIVTRYLRGKATRRVTITVSDKGKLKSLNARGYGEAELKKILSACTELIVFDEKPKKPKP